MEDLIKSLQFALDKYPQRLEIAPVRDLLIDSARKNDRRPAYVKLAVPDDVVKALRNKREDQDLVLLLRIPAEIKERAGSRIVLPGE